MSHSRTKLQELNGIDNDPAVYPVSLPPHSSEHFPDTTHQGPTLL